MHVSIRQLTVLLLGSRMDDLYLVRPLQFLGQARQYAVAVSELIGHSL